MKIRCTGFLHCLGATLFTLLLSEAMALSTPVGLSDRPGSGLSPQRILPRADDPVPLLRLGGPEYPNKEFPALPKSKAGDEWFQIPMDSRPLLRPGRTDSAARVKWPLAGWWQNKGASVNMAAASSSSSSTPPSKKSAWHRAAKAVKEVGRVGKLFKKQNHRRNLQLDRRNVLGYDHPFPVPARPPQALARHEGIDTGLFRRGQAPGKLQSAPSPSNPSWPTMFPLEHSDSDSRSSQGLGKQGSFPPSSKRKGKAQRLEIDTPPPSPRGDTPKLSRATSEVGLKAITPKAQELSRAASSPSSTRATWRPRRIRTPPAPSFLHKGRPVWEEWGQYFQPVPRSSWGGGKIKIAPKEVRQGKPSGKNPGGLSMMFGNEQS